MNLKKKMKKFLTLQHRADAGFTLVELIVVIAILAILAGVGSAGYAGYIKAANKGNDKVLVGDVMRALETSAYSSFAEFVVAGQFSEGIQIPVGFVVMSDETLTASNGNTGYVVAISNDAANDPIGKSLTAAFGENYSTNYKLAYTEWETGTIGGSTLMNATSGMMQKIDDVGALMIALDSLVSSMTEGDYEDTGDMIISVGQNISDYDGDGVVTDADKTQFVEAWLAASEKAVDSWGFGMSGRENYSAIRMAYSNSFAEYVRANYTGDKDVDTLADGIANYGQDAGDLAYEEANEMAGGGWKGAIAGEAAKLAANAAAPDAVFPYAATAKAFEDANFVGYGDQDVKDLYDEWLENAAAADAAMFYDTMLTAGVDGAKYAEDNGTDQFVDWFTEQANAYSANFSEVQSMVNGKSAIVVVAYYQDGAMNFDVFASEADPRT